MDLNILKERADAVNSSQYSVTRNYALEMIVSLSSSNIEPLELKGMLRLINKIDQFPLEYDKALKQGT